MDLTSAERWESADFNEILSELIENHPQFKELSKKFQNACRDAYESLKGKGVPEEDIIQILMLTDLQYELLNACTDAFAEILVGNCVPVKVKIPEHPTSNQALYLEMIGAPSGCLWGLDGSPEIETDGKI